MESECQIDRARTCKTARRRFIVSTDVDVDLSQYG
jgi:hypothetical protein